MIRSVATGKIDIRSLTPTQLVRLLNSTPLGPVVNSAKVNRQMNEAGMYITAGDARRVNLMKYVAWLARRHNEPKPQTLGYEEKLRRDLERQLVRSRHGRDIAPIPQVVDPKRKAACQDSFRLFCETYFPQAFHLAWSEDHLRVIGKIERAVIEGGLFAFAMPRGSGKALAVDTPMPTPSGWTTMGDVRVGDKLFNERGRQCRVTFATEVMHGRPCYRVDFSDGESIVCDGEHLWTVDDRFARRNPLTLRTADMVDRVRIGNRAEHHEHRYAIPLTEPLQVIRENLPIDPYVLGLWLANGSAASARITNHASDVPHLTYLVSRAGECLEPRPAGDRGLARGGILSINGAVATAAPCFQTRLRRLRVLDAKHIPSIYLRASADQRLALLQGLMDTDGSVGSGGRCEITLKDDALGRDVGELLSSLGIKYGVQRRWVNLDGRRMGPYLRYGFSSSRQMPVFRLSRKRDRLPQSLRTRAPRRRFIIAITPAPSVPVRCIQVDSPSQLYLAGKKMVPTHNTTLARIAGLWAILYGFREYVCLIGSAEDQAKMVLDATKRDMLSNALLLEDFPEAIYPIRKLENNARKQIGQLCDGEPTFITWSADKLVIPTIPGSSSSGSIITVAGLDSNIRGQQHTKMNGSIVRPSLVILDDPQTRQSAASTTQTKHRLAILNGDVLGMAGPGVKIAGFMTCTKIYHDDLADQILDREKNPEWQGECTKMVYAFPSAPESEKLWDRYAELRAEGLREGDGGKRATDFYRENRQQMDAGAVVAWPDRYNDDELSAIQHAMNLKLRDEEAFFAEYQNEPLTDQADEDVLTPDEVASRFNGRARMIVPQSATCVTMFIDVHDRLLYYTVCAWEPDFTGYVIDYGTYPDQKRRFFTMRDATRTLASVMGGSGTPGVEGAIQSGLTAIAGDYLGRSWQRTNEGALRIERCLIDSGYLPGVVANVCHVTSAVTMPSKGMGIRAGNKPMSTYRRKPGERHGHYWYVPNVSRTSEFPHVQFDTNYWKTFVHARLAQSPGDPGCLTLFGKSESEHRMFADHVAGSEIWVRTEGHGRIVQEWALRPSRPDNHWFDCLVGCAVAASMCGVRIGVERAERSTRQRVRLSDLQKNRR